MKKVREERNLKLANRYPPVPLHPPLESGKASPNDSPKQDEITVYVLGGTGTEGVFEWSSEERLTVQDLKESCGRLSNNVFDKPVVFFIHTDELLAFRRMIRTWRPRAVTTYTNMRTPWLPIEYNIGQLVEVSFGTSEKVCFFCSPSSFSLFFIFLCCCMIGPLPSHSRSAHLGLRATV